MQKLKIAFVIWDDSCAQQGWISQDEFRPGTSPILSVGFLIAESSKFITITNACTKHGDVNDALTIPKVAILKRMQMNIPLLILKVVRKLWSVEE